MLVTSLQVSLKVLTSAQISCHDAHLTFAALERLGKELSFSNYSPQMANLI